MSSPDTERNLQYSNSAILDSTTNPDPNILYNGQQSNVSSNPTVFSVTHGAQQPTIIPQFTHPSLFHQIFLKGKPRPLGIVLIVTAVLQVALGIACIFTTISTSIVIAIPFWGPVFYIIAGSLTIGAQVAPNICLVKGSMALNIISAVFSFVGFIFTCVDLHLINTCPYYEQYIYDTRAAGSFVLAALLITNLLLFSVSISVSVFGCWALCNSPTTVPQMFLIQRDVVVAAPPPYKVEEHTNSPIVE